MQIFSCRTNVFALTVMLAVLLALQGCGDKRYSDGDIRVLESVRYGTIVDVTEVIVEQDPSLIGPAIGGTIGWVIGDYLGTRAGVRVLSIIAGTVVGAELGGLGDADYRRRRYKALQLTIELESGNMLLVAMGYDDYYTKGDNVRILNLGEGKVRVQIVQ